MIRVASWNIKRFKARGEVSDEIIERVSATIIENELLSRRWVCIRSKS